MLKLALNKGMHASDNEQGINKLRPQGVWIKFSTAALETTYYN